MMLLSMISWMGLLVLIVAGWLILRLVKPRHGKHAGGGLKFLGIAAIVAGIAVFWIHPRRHVEIIRAPAASTRVIDDDLFGGLPSSVRDSIGRPIQIQHTVHESGPPRWVFISLGAGLVILGVLMFGRGGERPIAFKAVTLLGVGAILYAVVTFLGQAPRRSTSGESTTVVRLDRHEGHRIAAREYQPTRRHAHAKRPTRRPDRPHEVPAQDIDELPRRAGGIPVSVELERQATKAEPKKSPTAEPPAEPTPATPAEPPAEPAPPEPPADQQALKSSEPAAEADNVQEAESVEENVEEVVAPAVAETSVEASEEEKEPEPRKSTAKPAKTEPAKPAEPAPVESEAAVTESDYQIVTAGEPRPDWVDALPGLDHGVYSLPVRSGRFVTLPECQRALNDQIKEEADHYINEYLGEDQAAALVNIPISYLNDHVKKEKFLEVVQSKELEGFVGQMYEIHALLKFDDAAQADFRRRWRNAEVVNRLWYTGGAAALVLAMLATLYGYLKLDVRTGGAQKGRLQLAATLVALIAVAGVLLVRWAVQF